MDIPKGTTVFVLRDGINIYAEPNKNTDRKVLRVALKSRTYEPQWLKGWLVGEATGQQKTENGSTFIEINVIQSDWFRKNVFAGWQWKDSIGYIPTDAFIKDVYLFSKDGVPINFGETIVGTGGTGTQDGSGNGGGDTTDTTTLILWVMVFVLAMVAGFKALKRKNNG